MFNKQPDRIGVQKDDQLAQFAQDRRDAQNVELLVLKWRKSWKLECIDHCSAQWHLKQDSKLVSGWLS